MYQPRTMFAAALCLLLVKLNLDLCVASPRCNTNFQIGVRGCAAANSPIPTSVHIRRPPASLNPYPHNEVHVGTINHTPRPVHLAPELIINHKPMPVRQIHRPTMAPAPAPAPPTPGAPSVTPAVVLEPVAVEPGTVVAPQSSLFEQCAKLNSNYTTEKQSMHYVDGFESLAKTLVDLDETVQQMKPVQKICEPQQPSFNINIQAGEAELERPASVKPTVWRRENQTGVFADWAVTDYSTASPVSSVSTNPTESLVSSSTVSSDSVSSTTESFTDAPYVGDSSVGGRYRREDKHDASSNNFFGIPTIGSTSSPVDSDQAGEDLAKAASDLKTLRKDLNSTAEWLRQSNHYVHSAMLRALQAYVASIERRIEHQRQVYAQTKTFGLKSKVTAIKEKVASLIEKLRAHIG